MFKTMPLARWEWGVWYLFLVAWMQGMAVLNGVWGLLMLVLIRHLPQAWAVVRSQRLVLRVIALYLGWRVLTALLADYPMEAVVGLWDDFRALTVGLAALLFLGSQAEQIRAAWLCFIGVTLLSWWSLGWQLWHAGLQITGHTVYGSFAHLNYSATYSMIAMLLMLYGLIRLPLRKGWPLLLGVVPIAIMQVPLGSRTVLLAAAMGCVLFVLLCRQRKAAVALAAVGVGMVGLSAIAPQLQQQFASFSTIDAQLAGEKTMPSLQIRTEIWGLLWQIAKDHPLGVGPRNHGYVDLSPYRHWIDENMPTATTAVFGSATNIKPWDLDFLTYDPHSQYAEALVDGGAIGLISLLLMLFLPVWLVWHSDPPRLAVPAAGVVCWMFFWSGLTTTIFHQAGLIMFFLLLSLLMQRDESERRDGYG